MEACRRLFVIAVVLPILLTTAGTRNDASGHPAAGGGVWQESDAPAALANMAGQESGASSDVSPRAPPLRRTLLSGFGLACLLACAGVLWFAGGTDLVREPAVLRAASSTALLATVLLGFSYLDWLIEARPEGIGLLSGFTAAIATRTGVIHGAQVLLAGLVFFVAGGARAGRIGSFAAMIAVVLGAAVGHSATIDPRVALPANALHLGAAAIWIGGVLTLAVLPDHPETALGRWRYEDVAGQISARAFFAVGVIVGSAILLDVVFLDGPRDLLDTTYGRLLLAKAGGLTLLLGFGAWHRWKTLPRLVATGDQSHLRMAVRIEIFVLVGVVLLAAWLSQLAPPAAG